MEENNEEKRLKSNRMVWLAKKKKKAVQYIKHWLYYLSVYGHNERLVSISYGSVEDGSAVLVYVAKLNQEEKLVTLIEIMISNIRSLAFYCNK